LDWDGFKWILTGMCLTDEHQSAITREEYWLANANNKYLFWPRGKLPILHMKDIPYKEGSLDPLDWARREAHFRGEEEQVVATPPPKKASGNTRYQYATMSSPTIDAFPTVNPVVEEDDIKFPHDAASAPDGAKPAAVNHTNLLWLMSPRLIPWMASVEFPLFTCYLLLSATL
jgi:hypothetical protein